jgi:hypothetical protein
MTTMSESFVDLTYRGLSLGRRVKLTEIRPSTGYLEMPQPMPVGTAIAIATDDGVTIDATVVAIFEQNATSDRPPGMVVQPVLAGMAEGWWRQRVTVPAPPRRPSSPPPIPVRVASRRATEIGMAIPELLDDGQDTGVMDAVDPAALERLSTTNGATPPTDDARATTAMDAADLAALGLDPNAAATATHTRATTDSDGNDDGADGKARRKRKRR